MSSSNLVQITYEEEDLGYGVRMPPDAGSIMYTARFTDESLSGTPATTESQELRTDRMSSGQVVTGLDVAGPINWELSEDQFFDDWFEASMMSRWIPEQDLPTTVDLVPDPVNDQLATLTLADEFAAAVVGSVITFTPASGTKVICQVISVDTPSTIFTVGTRRGQEAVTGEVLTVTIPSYADIGSEQISFLVGKAYTDVINDPGTDENSQTYTGTLSSGFSVTAAYGDIVSGTFNTMSNGYEQEAPSYVQQVEAAGGTINPAGTTNPLNASIDVPLVMVGGSPSDFCVETLTIDLDNGLAAQNCIGKTAPTGYTLGTAAVSITTSIYLSASSYAAFMPEKLTQDPIAMLVTIENGSGGYGFELTAVQLSFPDPAATGQNQDTMIDAEGVGKVGPNGESALRIHKL
jgi:hypothetical protein